MEKNCYYCKELGYICEYHERQENGGHKDRCELNLYRHHLIAMLPEEVKCDCK